MIRWHKEVGVKASQLFLCVVIVSVVACAGKGERIDVAIPGKVTSTERDIVSWAKDRRATF